MSAEILLNSRKTRRRRAIRRLLFFIFGAGIILSGAIYVFYLPKFRIKDIDVPALKTLSQDEIKEFSKEILSAKIAGLLPADNILLAPIEKIKTGLKSKFLRIKEIEVSRRWPDILKIDILERSTWAVYCQKGEKNGCYLSDNQGLLFASAPEFEGNLLLKLYDERPSAGQFSLGDFILNQKNFTLISEFENELEKAGKHISKIIFKDDQEEFYVGSWKITLDFEINKETAIKNLFLALTEIGGFENKLDYIDLRFGDKIFYKFK
ncbi:MAG: FtsQ-type POTRA domain-containing protein [Candidatus Niyogibacteria bacterium]|nr:FtsQ-type POTRA domain-containing protein [Candidatus Niyogibacteria bacterium]